MKNLKNNANGIDFTTTNTPEVINNYSGEIVSLHTGYVFIGAVKFRNENIETNGHVFCPVTESHNFFVGQSVNFSQMTPDKERGDGKFRTEKIFPDGNNLLRVNTPEQIVLTTMILSKTISEYHENKLRTFTSGTELRKAAENMPFAGLIKEIVISQKKNYDQKDLNEMAKDFLGETFSIMKDCGLDSVILEKKNEKKEVKTEVQTPPKKSFFQSFGKKKEMNNTSKPLEDKNLHLFEELCSFYEKNGFTGQSDALKNEYNQFLRVQKIFNFMNDNDILTRTSVIDIKYLSELNFAFPVWYTNSGTELFNKLLKENLAPREQYLYRIYNKKARPISSFDGREIIPVDIVKKMCEAKEKQIFDHIVIMTPYYDVIQKEEKKREEEQAKQRAIDPIMIGFKEGMHHMFVIGRWSGTGIFPLFLDCISSTMKNLLFLNTVIPYLWDQEFHDFENKIKKNPGETKFTNFYKAISDAYQKGELFTFLRQK